MEGVGRVAAKPWSKENSDLKRNRKKNWKPEQNGRSLFLVFPFPHSSGPRGLRGFGLGAASFSVPVPHAGKTGARSHAAQGNSSKKHGDAMPVAPAPVATLLKTAPGKDPRSHAQAANLAKLSNPRPYIKEIMCLVTVRLLHQTSISSS